MIREVRSIESGDDNFRIAKCELHRDISSHLRRRRCGERNRWRSAEFLSNISDAEIARAKIVSPLAYAVCFVDSQQTDSHLIQSRRDVSVIESLRREVEKLQLPALSAAESFADLR